VVLVIDTSTSMGLQGGGSSPIGRAAAWARQYVDGLAPGDEHGHEHAERQHHRARPALPPSPPLSTSHVCHVAVSERSLALHEARDGTG